MNIKTIAEGWYNVIRDELGVLPENIKQLAEKRLTVCSSCPQRKANKCSACGCPLISKTKSVKATCPLSKW
jgi:hypothetical protein